MYELRSLTEYVIPYDPGFNINTIIPPSGVETKDAELNVRVKAKELCELVQVLLNCSLEYLHFQSVYYIDLAYF